MVLFLDSGIGGLIYLETFRHRNPRIPCSYLADNAYFPYGDRSPREVRDRVCRLVTNLMGQEDPRAIPSVVVVACNTASVVALKQLRKRFSIPFIGVVPAVKPAGQATGSGHIAILATSRTSTDPYTDDLVLRFARFVRVTRLGLPRLVHAAEEGLCGTDDTVAAVIREDVAATLDPSVDTVVLACTHFVRYRKTFEQILGSGVRVIDSLDGVVRRTETVSCPTVTATGASSLPLSDRTRLYSTNVLAPHLTCLRDQYDLRPFQVTPGGDLNR